MAYAAFAATALLSSLASAQEAAATTADAAPPEVAPAPVVAPAPAPPAPAPAPAPAPVIVAPAADESEPPPPEKHARRERTAKHEGFYLRVGTGPSLLLLDGHGPSGDDARLRGGGSGGYIAIGGAIEPGLVLAGTIQGAGMEQDFRGGPFADATVTANGRTVSASKKATAGFGMLGVLVDWYPKPRGGWHTGVATGLGVIALRNSADDSEAYGINFAGSLFGGYDWSLAKDWSLGLQLTASGGTKSKLYDDDENDTGYRLTPLSLGVQASLLYF